MMIIRLLASIAAAAVISAAAAAGEYAPPAGNAKTGETNFMKYGCYTCHGAWGQGTGRDGPRINPPLPYPALLQQLRTPRYEMPPFTAKVISDQGVADIYAYLASLPKPPDPKSIKALQ
jgi:ubiquinol-cytochrome c reductase cytochrome c subunit